MSDNVNTAVENSDISGGIAGRDYTINHTSNNIINNNREVSRYMDILTKKLKEELSQGDNGQIDSAWTSFFRETLDGELVGLEEKLKKGGVSRIKMPIYAKQEFVKKMARYEYYQSAQDIYDFLLGLILTNFSTHITPIIEAGHIPVEPDLIERHIYDPVLSVLGDNVLKFNNFEIMGMLYYLTGNCHIDWS